MQHLMRILLALILSIVVSAVLFVGAAMYGGMCHCMTAMFSLFPYGTYVMMHFSSDSWGLLLTFLQFPAYVLLVMLIKGWRYRLAAAILFIALHGVAASFALHDYCQQRATCIVQPKPLSRVAMRKEHFD